jgi:hypothetical protein
MSFGRRQRETTTPHLRNHNKRDAGEKRPINGIAGIDDEQSEKHHREENSKTTKRLLVHLNEAVL